jgi:phosphoribosylamine---glycine ligase
MKVLVIGSGGREHALCWKISQSTKVSRVYCAPGNGGISDIAECVDIKSDDIPSLIDFVEKNSIGLTVVGPEAPLTQGIVDAFQAQGLRIFGPEKNSAKLEESKIFAKQTMADFGLPTADFRIFDNPEGAKKYIDSMPGGFVVKADGLCAGKGVVIADTREKAKEAVDTMMVDKAFGLAGEKIIIEECLRGEEVSVILVSDGNDYLLFPSSQDHKRAFDNDAGPNTGGMGAYSPAPIATAQLIKSIETEIIQPLIAGLQKNHTPYKGVLYIGLMIVDNRPYVLEFNVRFGDPETQPIMMRLRSDILDIIEACIDNSLKHVTPVWDNRPAVSIVCASGGYPGAYNKGFEIHGLQSAQDMEGVEIFHAGTEKKHKEYFTSGGRVLGVTSLENDIAAAIDLAYKAVSRISFDGMFYRHDIGQKAIKTSL